MLLNVEKKECIVIVLASDQEYFEGLWVTLISLFLHTNTNKHIKIYVFDGGIEQIHKQQLEGELQKMNTNFSLKWLIPDLKRFEFFLSMGSSFITYSRILIPEVIFELKVIWLDVDLLVLADIELLWEQDIGKFPLAACLDSPLMLFKNDVSNLDKFQIPQNGNYFNMGVLIMNIIELKELDFISKCYKFLEENDGCYKYWDQSAINVICYNKIKVLERSFNQLNVLQQSEIEDLNLLRKGGYIYHFMSRPKAWECYSGALHSQLVYKIVNLSGFKFKKLKTLDNKFEVFKWHYPSTYKKLNYIVELFKKRSEKVIENLGNKIKIMIQYRRGLKPYHREIDIILDKLEGRYHDKINSNVK